MAELVRGGLQAIPNGQYEASDAVGLNTLQKYRFIIMPQTLRILIPPLTGAVIGTFKSSSLVALVGLIDLVGVARVVSSPIHSGWACGLNCMRLCLFSTSWSVRLFPRIAEDWKSGRAWGYGS